MKLLLPQPEETVYDKLQSLKVESEEHLFTLKEAFTRFRTQNLEIKALLAKIKNSSNG